jgi:hypothetical protein
MPLRGPFVIMGALGLAVLAASLFAVLTSIGRAEAITMSPVSTLITIDAHYGATFAAPPSNAAPALTAQRAWAQFTQQASGSSNTAIPSSVTRSSDTSPCRSGQTAAHRAATSLSRTVPPTRR